MRDENGFKMHVQSESHVRRISLVAEDPKKYIAQYTNDFQSDFLKLLRTAHGEKMVDLNRFYQEYIANKEHVHMNSTRWPSLTEFAKYVGREGICRVEESEQGKLMIGWIDNSPEALRRADAVRKKEMQDKGDEVREQQQIKAMVRKAQEDAAERELPDGDEESRELKRTEGEKIKLSFGAKPAALAAAPAPNEPGAQANKSASPKNDDAGPSTSDSPPDAEAEAATKSDQQTPAPAEASSVEPATAAEPTPTAPAAPPKVSMKMSFAPKPKNVFAAAKKNALGGKKVKVVGQPKKMSEAERIMKEEMERAQKRGAPTGGFGFNMGAKKPRFG